MHNEKMFEIPVFGSFEQNKFRPWKLTGTNKITFEKQKKLERQYCLHTGVETIRTLTIT